MKAAHTKKLSLWIGNQVARAEGPTNKSTTPLTHTTKVESTTIGAITRNGHPGAPFSR